MITKWLLVFWSNISLWNLVCPRFCLCWSQMGSLSKKVWYPRDNFLLSACQLTASSQGNNGKFTEFVCLHGANSISQKSPVLPADTLFHLFTKVFFTNLLFCPFAKVFHHQSFPLYGNNFGLKQLSTTVKKLHYQGTGVQSHLSLKTVWIHFHTFLSDRSLYSCDFFLMSLYYNSYYNSLTYKSLVFR